MEAAFALAHPDTAQTPAVVAASGLTRRYGAGDTAVDALRGVSLSIPRGELTAVMGPSGSSSPASTGRARAPSGSTERI